jgi:hypothetical protein
MVRHVRIMCVMVMDVRGMHVCADISGGNALEDNEYKATACKGNTSKGNACCGFLKFSM